MQAAAGRMLYDTSDMERVGGEAATAAMQEGTRRCCACHLRDLLPCLGGVAAVLPIFAQLGMQLPVSDQSGIETWCAACIPALGARLLCCPSLQVGTDSAVSHGTH